MQVDRSLTIPSQPQNIAMAIAIHINDCKENTWSQPVLHTFPPPLVSNPTQLI